MIAALLLACSPRPPSAHLDDLVLTGLGWESATAELHVAVDNPLRVDVPLTGLRWTLAVADQPVGQGTLDQPVTIGADRTTVVAVPIELRYAALASALTTDAIEVPYTTSVEVDLASPAGVITLPLTYSGTLPTLTAPTVDVLAASLTREGTTGRVDLDLAIGLPAWVASGALAWRVGVDGQLLGSGSAALVAGRLSVRLQVDGSAVAWASWDTMLGRTRSARLDLEGALTTSYGSLPVRLAKEIVFDAP